MESIALNQKNEDMALSIPVTPKPFTGRRNDIKLPKTIRTEKPNSFGGELKIKYKKLKELTIPKSLHLNLEEVEESERLSETYPPVSCFNIGEHFGELLQELRTKTTYFLYEIIDEDTWKKLKNLLKSLATKLGFNKEHRLFAIIRTEEGVELTIRRDAPDQFLAEVPRLAA